MKAILNRMYEVIIKMTSVKGLTFIVATVLLFLGRIDATVWWLTAAVVIGGRALEKATAK